MEEVNMKEVNIEDLQPGREYYIQREFGAYVNPHNESGRAIGKNLLNVIAYKDIPDKSGLKTGLSPDFNDDELFAQFEKVVPANPGIGYCGICDYNYYPSVGTNWDNLTVEQKQRSRGGYKFLERKIPGILYDSFMRQELSKAALITEGRPIETKYMTPAPGTWLGGRRRRKTKTKRRRKTKTKRRRKKTNTRYSKV